MAEAIVTVPLKPLGWMQTFSGDVEGAVTSAPSCSINQSRVKSAAPFIRE